MSRFSFNCTRGCGACEVTLAEFEYFRSEAADGTLIKSCAFPRIVSKCCHSDVHVWDEQKQDVTGDVLGVLEPKDAQ